MLRYSARPSRRRPGWRHEDSEAPQTVIGAPQTGVLAAQSERSCCVRIVRLANFIAPRSGGLRTAMRALGEGYLAAGHEPVLIIPGRERSDEITEQGRVITL